MLVISIFLFVVKYTLILANFNPFSVSQFPSSEWVNLVPRGVEFNKGIPTWMSVLILEVPGGPISSFCCQK